MRKLVTAAALAALVSTPALANQGHVIQIHRGSDCIEFATLEDANAICGAPNVYLASGTIDPNCLSAVPWYGISVGGGSQTSLTLEQIPFFISFANAIETSFHFTRRKPYGEL